MLRLFEARGAFLFRKFEELAVALALSIAHPNDWQNREAKSQIVPLLGDNSAIQPF